jgi:NAD(P)-dependent dehydrogenase (short-subunit alcohol dehydrogenase family)
VIIGTLGDISSSSDSQIPNDTVSGKVTGVQTPEKPFYEIHPHIFRKVVDTNLTGYFLVARGFLPMMIEQKRGRIVNISTSFSTMNMFAPYGPSRAGSEALSNIMAAELNKLGIMVNLLLSGGAVNTGEILNDMILELPFTLLSPEIMAAPIVFGASSLADGITGEA